MQQSNSGKQATGTPENATNLLFSSYSRPVCHVKHNTNNCVYENGCFTLGKRCFSDWQLVFKHGSGHLQSYFLFLQQCKERRKSHLVFQETCLCCIITADNWNCNKASFFWIMFQPSCNYFSFVLNMLLLVEVAKLVNVLACRYTWRGVRAPSLTLERLQRNLESFLLYPTTMLLIRNWYTTGIWIP